MTLSLLSLLRTIWCLLIWFACELIPYYLIWAEFTLVRLFNSFWTFSDSRAAPIHHSCLRHCWSSFWDQLGKMYHSAITDKAMKIVIFERPVLKPRWFHMAALHVAFPFSNEWKKIQNFTASHILLTLIQCFEVYMKRCVNSGAGQKCWTIGL